MNCLAQLIKSMSQILTGSVTVHITALLSLLSISLFLLFTDRFFCFQALTERARSGHKLVLGEFLSASAICTVFSGSNQIHADVDIDVASANTKFDLTPIESVSVAMTALSKSVLGQDKHGIVSNQVKSG